MFYEISELVFYVILIGLAVWLIPIILIYPGLYYGRWNSKGPTFTFEGKDSTQLEGMMFSPESDSKVEYTFLYLNDRSLNMGSNISKMKQLKETYNAHVVTMDYRGLGASYGMPSQSGITEDVKVLFNRVINDLRCKDTKVIVLGTGLGASVAIDLVTDKDVKDKVDYLILDQSVESSKALMRNSIPHTKSVPDWIMDFVLSSNSWTPEYEKIEIPTLFLNTKNSRIPKDEWDKSFKKISSKVKSKAIYGTEFLPEILKFLPPKVPEKRETVPEKTIEETEEVADGVPEVPEETIEETEEVADGVSEVPEETEEGVSE